MLGWRLIGEVPTEKQFLFVALPHTSNWDFIYGWLAVNSIGLKVQIFAKDTYFFFPANLVCKMLGVLPVNRRERTNFVDSVADLFDKHDELKLFIAPEGTRSYKPTLKSGYYYIAQKANIPLVVAGPNYQEKSFTILKPRNPMATFAEDEAQVIEFARSQNGRIPDKTFQ